MAAGYALAPGIPAAGRATSTHAADESGLLVTVGFVVLRATNLYGDPAPWACAGWLRCRRLLSFINCEKYPPSLLYLAMTIGPGLILLCALSERQQWPLRASIVAIGRVPFLFDVAHIVLLHAMAVAVAQVTVGDIGWLFRHMPAFNKPDGLRPHTAGHLCPMDRGADAAVSLVPLVRRTQAASQRLVAELPVERTCGNRRCHQSLLRSPNGEGVTAMKKRCRSGFSPTLRGSGFSLTLLLASCSPYPPHPSPPIPSTNSASTKSSTPTSKPSTTASATTRCAS